MTSMTARRGSMATPTRRLSAPPPRTHPILRNHKPADLSSDSDSDNDHKLEASRLIPGDPEASETLMRRRSTIHGGGADTTRRSSSPGTMSHRPSATVMDYAATDRRTSLLHPDATHTHRGSLAPRMSVTAGMASPPRMSLDPTMTMPGPSASTHRRRSVAERKAEAREILETRRATLTPETRRRSSTATEDDMGGDAIGGFMFPAPSGEHLQASPDRGNRTGRRSSSVTFAPQLVTTLESPPRRTDRTSTLGATTRRPSGTLEDGGFSAALPLPGRHRNKNILAGADNKASPTHRSSLPATHSLPDDSFDQGSVGHSASPARSNSASPIRSASVPTVGGIEPGFKFGKEAPKEDAGTRSRLRGTLTKVLGREERCSLDKTAAECMAGGRRGTTAKAPVVLPGGPSQTMKQIDRKGPTWYDTLLGPTLWENGLRIPTASFINRPTVNYIALYFSAAWCPPCTELTCVLLKAYPMLEHHGFGVIFVSADSTQEKFNDHYRNMPWAAIPWREDLHKISAHFGVMGIPKVIVLFPDDGTIATAQAGAFLMDDYQRSQNLDFMELRFLLEAVKENEAAVGSGGGGNAEDGAQTSRRRAQMRDSCALM